jgi:DNA mismatch repair protein MutS
MATMYSQYRRIKDEHQDAVLLFRLGDFYETFEGDAVTASKILNITLTARSMGKKLSVPMAGIPAHTLENYLGKLLNAGLKVALCEQVSQPGNGLVDREVVQLLTPGMAPEFSVTSEDMNNFIVAVVKHDGQAGVAYADVSTGEFGTTQLAESELGSELERLRPIEVIIDDGEETSGMAGIHLTKMQSDCFQPSRACATLMVHLGVNTLEAYGADRQPLAVTAAGVLIQYVNKIDKNRSAALTTLRSYNSEQVMRLDHQTRKNLELFEDKPSGQRHFSLYGVLNQTHTPMGARLLRSWISSPESDVNRIEIRLDAVEAFLNDHERRQSTRSTLKGIKDLERLVNRLSTAFVTPAHLLNINDGLKTIPQVTMCLAGIENSRISELRDALDPCLELSELLDSAIIHDNPSLPGSGNTIKPGFSDDLDRLKQGLQQAKTFIARIEYEERERTGIKSLKVRYNKVFGYFIEITASHLQEIPDNYIRRQTLVNSERFITEELKEHESVVLSAEGNIESIEKEIFQTLREMVMKDSQRIVITAKAIGEIDAILSLSEVASRNAYVRPTLSNEREIRLINSRHPVVEGVSLNGGFVGNDVDLSGDKKQLAIVTGPNMSGKSTFIRQVALVVLMAQIGSFVPADHAVIGIVDAIFTRVGLHDDLAQGQSTFMVEMVETANILNSASPNSLLILDEIGRGTSTYDGLAIAQAVAEYIHESPRLGAITLFATHYHEMTSLARSLERVVNLCVEVAEEKGQIRFLHKIVPGAANKSYGVNVAQLAGIPELVIERAKWLLQELEAGMQQDNYYAVQGSLFGLGANKEGSVSTLTRANEEDVALHSIGEELASLDLNAMPPIEALNILYSMRSKLQVLKKQSYERADL